MSFSDGETVRGTLDDILEEEDTIVLADISSSVPQKYEKFQRPHHVVAHISEVVSYETWES
jgi:hypothetical protein